MAENGELDVGAVSHELHTPRLLLRRWRTEDCAPFAALNADPLVMEHFPALLTREESDRMVERIEDHFQEHGFGLWAVELPGIAPFIGFVGLAIPRFEASFTPCVEIGWRLVATYWGHGYATEAAKAAAAFGFEHLRLSEILSFTAVANRRSQPRHGKDRHDARPGRRLRPPAAPCRPSFEPACPLPAAALSLSRCATTTDPS
jgi:RimJ/RimL family protein N-acetyltransferase